ncbi:4Fe-4S binding protein [Ferrimicrobium sp.]|uniref:ATP-binding protein n=1 Tax=Ferrimicrobium sp. TaxID=2926050 RepID=UPI00344C5977
MITITDACTGCGACIVTCPTHALKPHPRHPRWSALRCEAHRECVEICPVGAIDWRIHLDTESEAGIR